MASMFAEIRGLTHGIRNPLPVWNLILWNRKLAKGLAPHVSASDQPIMLMTRNNVVRHYI